MHPSSARRRHRVVRPFALSFAFWLAAIGTAARVEAADPRLSKAAEEAIRELRGKVISEIAITGLKRIEKDAIHGKLVTKKGEKLSSDGVREDLEAIYKMGYFDDIEVRAEAAGGQAKVSYAIKERPVISSLKFEGNEQISTSDLQEVIKTKEWSILDVNRIKEDVGRIQKHYEDKGFYLAKVRYDLAKVSADEVALTFRIRDFDKVRIRKITFLNNKVFTDDQLKAVMGETREGGLFSFMSGSGNFKESAFKQDLQRLTLWYLDAGYVKFRYENPAVTVSDDKKWLYITIYVDEGEKFSMANLDFSGDLLFPKDELHGELTLTKEEVFRISERNNDIQRLTEKYQDLGYAFTNVIPKMEVHDESRTVDIVYHFEKGNLVHFGEIRVVGNAKTHDKVIRRELRVNEGELYSGTKLRVSRERVERLGYFAPGEVIFNTITPKGKEDVLDVEISVKERSTGTITLGAGYGSIQKFFITTQISEINLFGKGQTLSFQANYAADARSKSFNLGFTDPYIFDTNWSAGFDLFFINFPIPRRYTMRKLGFDVRFGYPLEDDLYAYITYKNEGLKITEKANPALDSSADEGVLSSVIWSLVRDKRNNRFEPTDGNYQSASVETAGLGGDKRFLKWNVNNRYYTRLVGDLIFRNSTEYGQIAQVAGSPIPPAEKFYLGGPNNMKGFQAFTLAPARVNFASGTPFVEPVGGVVQIFSLFELEYPLIREAGLKWVLFFDTGNTWEHFPGVGTEPFTLRSDWGFGLRWFSPIGPLRFEWGFPFARRPDEDSPVFQFFIGPPF